MRNDWFVSVLNFSLKYPSWSGRAHTIMREKPGHAGKTTRSGQLQPTVIVNWANCPAENSNSDSSYSEHLLSTRVCMVRRW